LAREFPSWRRRQRDYFLWTFTKSAKKTVELFFQDRFWGGIEEHANIITSQKMKTWDKSHRPVNLVSAFSTSVFTGKELQEMGL
jgi:hypothetical protein